MRSFVVSFESSGGMVKWLLEGFLSTLSTLSHKRSKGIKARRAVSPGRRKKRKIVRMLLSTKSGGLVVAGLVVLGAGDPE